MSNPNSPELAAEIDRLITVGLAEDVGSGDATSQRVIPANLMFDGILVAREPMVTAGLDFAASVFAKVDPNISVVSTSEDGRAVPAGSVLARLRGPARGLLTAERTALNLLQHLSGIATLTRRYVDAIAGTGATLLDTRKTIPGLRHAAKYATRMGGAQNHRIGLFDAVLIKDNHIAVCGSIAEAVRLARSGPGPQLSVEVECDRLDQVGDALAAGADIIMFDNMSLTSLREAVRMVSGAAKTEASGGVTLETIRAIAETGVDFISVGRLTQSAPSIDIGLDWEMQR